MSNFKGRFMFNYFYIKNKIKLQKGVKKYGNNRKRKSQMV